MRNTDDSGNTALTMALSSFADCRSWPNGFSITTRRQLSPSSDANPLRSSCSQTVGKALGGIDR